MKTGLIFVVVFSIIRGCSSRPACISSHQRPVVGACTNTQSVQVAGPLYIDTGTGPNGQENLCRCSLSVSHTNITLVFQYIPGANNFNHSIEVAGYVLNITTTRLEVVVKSDQTELLIKTDGIGGVCVSVETPDNQKRFSIICFPQESTIWTTTTSSSSLTSTTLQTTNTETTGTNPTSSSKSQTNVPDQDNESLIGPVVGGVGGFVVLVSITAIAIYCIRRKHSKLKENGTHLDKTSNAQTNSKYNDTMENSVSDKAVADNRAISIIDNSYDDVNLDRDSGCHKDKKKQPENDCHFSVYHANEKPVRKAVTNQNEEKLAFYSVVNKHPKLQTNTQNTNENVYDRTNNSGEKEKRMKEYNRLGDNVYDRSDNSVEKVKGREEYNRLEAFQVRGIDTDETYDSAATNTGYNVDRDVQNDYSTSYRKQ